MSGGGASAVYRALVHHWRMSLAVAAGAAVATAVLTGALVVGDSVRGSLRQLTLERLGEIDQAMAARRFVDTELAAAIAAAPGVAAVAPAIFLEGGVEHAASGARAAGVGLHGIDERFLALFPETALDLAAGDGPFPPIWIDEGLAGELGAAPGDDVVLSLERWTAVPRGSLLGRKGTGDVVQRIRARIVDVLPPRGLARFSLESHQAAPRVAFLRLADLQRQLRQGGTINGLAVAMDDAADESGSAEAATAALDTVLRGSLDAADLGLVLTPRDGYLQVESEELVIAPELAETIATVARDAGATAVPILTYIANRIALATDGDGGVPYSTLTALELPPPAAIGELVAVDGGVPAPLGDDEIVLDTVTVADLGASVGDPIAITYFEVGPREELDETTTRLRLAGVVAKDGLAADRELAQEVAGVADAANMADWDPPFPIDLSRVRSVDEEYWDTYRAAPRGFVSLATGQRLWRTRWGQVTSYRLVPADGDVAALAATVARELPERVSLAAAGLGFLPVRARGLAGATGSSDFGGLFVGLSSFLILSAALVAALLFRLGVERRTGEIGLLLALGHPPRRVRRRLLAEGVVLAAAGAVAGLLGAVGYAAAVMAALRTWWRPAVGTSRLELHVEPTSLAIGALAAVVVVALAIAWTLRRVGRVPAVTLLRGDLEPRTVGGGRGARWTAVAALGTAAACLAFALFGGRRDDPALFFAVGPLVLAGGLALFALALGGGGGLAKGGSGARWRLAVGNAGRQRGRSLLAATLVATASFLVVAVASYQEDLSRRELGRDSGTGGFELVAESDVPLLHDLEDPEGQLELGLGDEAAERLAAVDVVPLRLLPGDDTSCLNLYQPEQPQLLGVTPELVERGGFTFRATLDPVAEPWTLLGDDGDGDDGDSDVVPMVGDVNSTQWILKLGLGDELEIADELGGTMRLRLVATLDTSLFQSELLVPEAALLRHFPSRAGYGYFLLDVPPDGDPAAVAQVLESGLAAYGFDATSAAERLASFHTVQNTYLQTFLVLGGLGLLLGTVGLAIVQARNVVERRGELATLRAFGFRRGTLRRMVATENAVLLVAGLAIGTVAALLAVLPHLLAPAAAVPWRLLALVLAGVLGFGLVAGTAVAALALSAPLVATLKAER